MPFRRPKGNPGGGLGRTLRKGPSEATAGIFPQLRSGSGPLEAPAGQLGKNGAMGKNLKAKRFFPIGNIAM